MADNFSEDLSILADRLGGQIEQRFQDHSKAYEAQAEAYEKVSEALIKINAEIRSMDARGIELRAETKMHLKELVRGVITIGEQLKAHHSVSRDSDQNLERRMDELIQSVMNIIRGAEGKEDAMNDLADSTSASYNRILDKLTLLESKGKDHADVLEVMSGQVAKMSKVHSVLGWIFTVVAIGVGVVETLIQLGVWKIQWFGHN